MDRHQINFFSQPSWPQDFTEASPDSEELYQSLFENKGNEAQRSYYNKYHDAERNQVMDVESVRSKFDFMEQMFQMKEVEDLVQIIESMKSLPIEGTQPSVQEIAFDSEISEQNQSSFSISQEEEQSDYQLYTANIKKRKPIAKYKMFSKQDKKRIVQDAKSSNVRGAAQRQGISTEKLTRWIQSSQKKKGAGRRVRDNQMEDNIKAWIMKEIQAKRGHKLTRKMIQRKAKTYAKNPAFKASKGWLERFVARNVELGLNKRLNMASKRKDEDDLILENFSSGFVQDGTISRASDRLKEKRELGLNKREVVIKGIYSEEC